MTVEEAKNKVCPFIRIQENKPCPKCNSHVIRIPGCSWDYDIEFCSNRECKYEIEYETSTESELEND